MLEQAYPLGPRRRDGRAGCRRFPEIIEEPRRGFPASDRIS